MTTQPDAFPIYTVDGRWHVEDEAWTNWTEGFLGGLVWIIARRTGDAWWREQAERYSLLIEPRKDDRTVHDLGFLFISTWKRWFEATGDPAKWDTVVHAGRTMALRFNEKGRYLRSFVSADSCFIDIMMNVGIIFEAARATGDKDLLRIATEHCLTTRRHLVRGDGSTAHEAIFDLETGEFLRNGTHQGWRADSSWARGQAWALYGFGTAYALSGDERFLDTAERCADFFLDRTGDAIVPPNDWEEPASAASLRIICGRDRGERPVATGRSHRPTRTERNAIATRRSRSSRNCPHPSSWRWTSPPGRGSCAMASTTSAEGSASTKASCGATTSSSRPSIASSNRRGMAVHDRPDQHGHDHDRHRHHRERHGRRDSRVRAPEPRREGPHRRARRLPAPRARELEPAGDLRREAIPNDGSVPGRARQAVPSVDLPRRRRVHEGLRRGPAALPARGLRRARERGRRLACLARRL